MSRRFYNKEEFQIQYEDYLAQGLNPADARARVLENEEEDRREYDEWREESREDEWDD